VQHLIEQIRERAAVSERVLITALTKRLAEDLSAYMKEENIRCEWLHSELNAVERVEVLRELREGKFDAVIGVNLLREGLDLPEVSLVAILDADKEGFLRSETSLIQTIGRSARNVNAKVILYADTVTESMQRAIDETNRRRKLQMAYNEEHGITPETIRKAIRKGIEEEIQARRVERELVGVTSESQFVTQEYLRELESEMLAAAEQLDFERAAHLRDRIHELKKKMGQPVPDDEGSTEPGFATKGQKGFRGKKGGRKRGKS
jgi:excinuclease ABC subunit B